MKKINFIKKYISATQIALIAVAFVIATPVSVFAQEYSYNDDVSGGSDYTYNDDVSGGSDYTYNQDVSGGSDYTYNDDVYGGSDYGYSPVSTGEDTYYSYPVSYSTGYSTVGTVGVVYPSVGVSYPVSSYSSGRGHEVTVSYPQAGNTVNNYYSTSTYNYGYGYNNNTNTDSALSGTCSVSGTANVGSNLVWSASASGGNGFYNYYWTGDESLSANGQSVNKTYTYTGTKNATVTITSDGQSITRSCSVNVNNNNQVLAYTDTPSQLSSVYLSDVPYTGAEDNAKTVLFITMIVLWSAVLSYIMLKRKQSQMIAVSATESKSESRVQTNSDRNILESIETIARNNKVILSSEAVMKLAKLQQLNHINPKDILSKLSKGDWTTVGEKEVEASL